MIPYGRQDISEADIQAVIDVLKSDYLTQGPVTPAFEKAISEYCGVNFAFAMNSATSALHAACLALDVGLGDVVWTTAVTFAASANCALYCGASVDFVDIDPQTFNLSTDSLETKLLYAKDYGQLPKVVIPVHLCGQPCNMKRIKELSLIYGFKIIEDASHAIGGKYCGEPIGNCAYSDITVFSFHPVKIVTTAEGGMAVTNNTKYAKKLELMRSHGITRNTEDMVSASQGPWYYEQIDLGYNYRMTDLQSALGLSQMGRLDKFVEARHRVADLYKSMLQDSRINLPWQHPEGHSALHLFVVRVNRALVEKSHSQIFKELRNLGVGVNLHYIPVYLHPYYQKQGFVPGYCPEAEKYYSEAISLPMYPKLTEQQQNKVVTSVFKVLGP
jgi:UDP-4-amino-4,6-dideoxy-N-acetyl-beta-L-altrosamine transaminase